jgi:hypothetical protein
MTRSETFGQEGFSWLQAHTPYAFFHLFSSHRPSRQSGGFSDLNKRRDFEGRTPMIHETIGFGACGSPKRTRLKQNPQVLFRN